MSEATLDTHAEDALEALKTSASPDFITQTGEPIHSKTKDAYTTSATYDFPDGGRFRISLSGPPFTPFVNGENGLPDGFLMEVNNFIFSSLCHATTPKPADAVTAILKHASKFYARRKSVQTAALDRAEDIPRTPTSPIASAALMKQLSMLEKMDTLRDGFLVKPKDDNLYVWKLNLFFDNADVDLAEHGHESLELELRFPSDFPYSPPFVRVVAPVIKCKYVLPRGGICMQLFSTSGWTPANSIDAVCVQIRAMLMTGGVKVVENETYKYSYEGAKRDSQSAMRLHRWDEVSDKGRRRKKMKF